MSARVAVLLCLALVFSTADGVSAQTARKAPHVGLLSVGTSSSAPLPPQWMAFVDGLRELGYVEGKNIHLERRFAGGRSELVGDLARELVKGGVDVIVGTGIREIRAAMAATKTIPTVMIVVDDPVGDGLVASLSRPGGNVTGLSFSTTGIGGKYVELLQQAVPSATKIRIVGSRVQPASLLTEAQTAAKTLGITLLPPAIVKDRDEIGALFVQAKRDGVGGLVFPSDALVVFHRNLIVELAAKHGVPAMYAHREAVDIGGLMAYGPSFPANFRRAATYVDKILKGARPANLPVEQPSTFELVLNLKTATALGLAFPPGLLARAEEVIQ